MDFKAILVATDFSECAGAAFEVAKRLARQFGAKIVVLHVIQQRTSPFRRLRWWPGT